MWPAQGLSAAVVGGPVFAILGQAAASAIGLVVYLASAVGVFCLLFREMQADIDYVDSERYTLAHPELRPGEIRHWP